jgi:hypothetical protein
MTQRDHPVEIHQLVAKDMTEVVKTGVPAKSYRAIKEPVSIQNGNLVRHLIKRVEVSHIGRNRRVQGPKSAAPCSSQNMRTMIVLAALGTLMNTTFSGMTITNAPKAPTAYIQARS